ncbi:MAG: hypothetical protein KGL39_41810 [Patescibacteria group bacterium]|nr:hypothetical protein [Patescibacteria group bacterium]
MTTEPQKPNQPRVKMMGGILFKEGTIHVIEGVGFMLVKINRRGVTFRLNKPKPQEQR